jgi:DNA-binding XRE family transcriptional regulator
MLNYDKLFDIKFSRSFIDWDRTLNRAVPNYKKPNPLVITLRLSLYPDRTLGERIRKWRLEHGLFQTDLAKKIGVSEMSIVNWEKGRTRPNKQSLERLEKILGNLPSS